MKVKIKQKKQRTEYPKLMNLLGDYNVVFFFVKKCEGFVIWSADSGYKIGDSEITYNMDCFEDFEGKIILKNK